MCPSETIMAKRPGNPNLNPRLHLYFLTYLVSCIYLLGVFPVTVHSSSPPINKGAVSSDSQAVRGSSSLTTLTGNEASPSTPLVSLLVSATSSSSASVPTSLAASSSTLGLLASSTDQELDNETSDDQAATKTDPPIATPDSETVKPKGEVLPDRLPKSGSDPITTNKRGSDCVNGTGNCVKPVERVSLKDKDPKNEKKVSLDKDPKNEKPITPAATTKEIAEEKSTVSDTNTGKTTLRPSSTTDEELPSTSIAESKSTTTGATTSVKISTTTPQPKTTIVVSSSSLSSSTEAAPKTTVTTGTTTTVPTTSIPTPNPTPRDYIYGNQGDLSDYSEYSDARFAEERRRDQNGSSPFRDHSRDIGDDLDLYDIGKDMNPTEGAAYERTRPNRNMSTGTGSSSSKDGFLQANLTGKNNSTNKQIFFPEHYPSRKMKHRTWFAQQHRLGRHGLGSVDDGPFSSLIWKDKKYLISVLVPIGVGIAGAVIFVVAAYATRSCRGAPQTFIPTVGTDLFLQHVHSRNDDIFLLMETTDDEM